MKNLLLLCLIISVISCASKDVQKEQAQLHLQIGTGLLSKGQYPQALASLLQAEKLDPDNAEIQNNLGLAYFVRKEYESSLKHMNQAIKLKPQYTEARNNKGRILIEIGRYDEAISELSIVVKDLTYASPAKGLINLGVAYLKKGQSQTALNYFRKSIEANSQSCEAHHYFGLALFQEQKFDAAIESFETSLKLCNQKYDEPHYYNALCYYKIGQRDKARTMMREVIKLYPESEYARKAQDLLRTMQ